MRPISFTCSAALILASGFGSSANAELMRRSASSSYLGFSSTIRLSRAAAPSACSSRSGWPAARRLFSTAVNRSESAARSRVLSRSLRYLAESTAVHGSPALTAWAARTRCSSTRSRNSSRVPGVSESGSPPRRPTARWNRRTVTSSRSSIRISTESGSGRAGFAAAGAFVAGGALAAGAGAAFWASEVPGVSRATKAAPRRSARSDLGNGWRIRMRACDQGVRGRRWERNSLAGLTAERSRGGSTRRGLPPSRALPRLVCPMQHVGSSLARFARSCALLVGLAGLPAAVAQAEPIRLVASDARGVTIQVTVGAWTLSASGPSGRVRVNRLDGSHALAEPGRATLPAFATTLAIPADARPTARVIGTDGLQSRDGVRLEIAGKPIFLPDAEGRLGLQPAMEQQNAIDDGTWPQSSIQLAAPFAFRGRRFVQLEVRPFRYDEAGQRISSPLTLTVRVDWNRPASSGALAPGTAGRDAQVDAALEGNVLNWEQGQGWRKTPTLERSRPGRTLPG